jgi:hypothetical protein
MKCGRRKVERPSYEQLLSDNAVRKWLRRYEAELKAAA